MTIQFESAPLSLKATQLFTAIEQSNVDEFDELVSNIAMKQLKTVLAEQNVGVSLLEFALHKKSYQIIQTIVDFLPHRIIWPILHKTHEEGVTLFTKFKTENFGKEDFTVCNVLQSLELHYNAPPFFKSPQFSNPISKILANLIESHAHDQLEIALNSINKDEFFEVLSDLDASKGINLLSFAAHLNNTEAVDALCATLEIEDLKKILLLNDSGRWTAFHHLAIMKDKGERYKALKAKTGINTKSIGDFFCESPFMLRKYIKKGPHPFKAVDNTNKSGFHLFFREGDLEDRVEHRLGFQDFKENFGHLTTVVPKTFQVIPYGKPEYFRLQWIKGPGFKNNKMGLVDTYLRRVLQIGEDEGVALTTVTRKDDGKRIPAKVKLGLGIETRKYFKTNDLVTMYGGELVSPWEEARSLFQCDAADGSLYRSYGSSILHSTPNVFFCTFPCSFGSMIALIAVEDIPENTPVCVDYGEEYFKLINMIPLEIRPKAYDKLRSDFEEGVELNIHHQDYLNNSYV
jgi:hypothetical protein